jgi:hypothetical protein
MQVQFHSDRESARRANREDICAVALVRLRRGWHVEVDRSRTGTKMTTQVVAAIYAKWLFESKQKPNYRPRLALCSAPRDWLRDSVLLVSIGKGRLTEWVAFMEELLAREESWLPYESPRDRRLREREKSEKSRTAEVRDAEARQCPNG